MSKRKNINILKKTANEIKKTLKKYWIILVHNPEALLVLILAGIGLTYLIGEMTTKTKCPSWMEKTMVAPVISCLGMSGIILLMQRRIRCELRKA